MGLGRSPFITKMAIPSRIRLGLKQGRRQSWKESPVYRRSGRAAVPTDAVQSPRDARLPEHKKLIISIGLQDHRKGVDYLIRACARWQPVEPASIVLAGMLSAEIRLLITNEYRHIVDDGRLIVLDRYLSNEEINTCCAAGNLIAAPYRLQPDPSSIVLHAATAERMVLGANNGWLAMVPKLLTGSALRPSGS